MCGTFTFYVIKSVCFVIFCSTVVGLAWVGVKIKSKLNFVGRGEHLCTLGFMHE